MRYILLQNAEARPGLSAIGIAISSGHGILTLMDCLCLHFGILDQRATRILKHQYASHTKI